MTINNLAKRETGLARFARLSVKAALAELGSTPTGLTVAEVSHRRRSCGPNSIRTHRVTGFHVLGRQLRNPILVLLVATVVVSAVVGDVVNSLVIAIILGLAVTLGFISEFRAERAASDLHARISFQTTVVRDGTTMKVPVADLVPGDVVMISMGSVVPADLRLMTAHNLECNESVVTGESLPVRKSARAAWNGKTETLSSCALMGTVVHAGAGTGLVVSTGGATVFGGIALGMSRREPETDFQAGLRRFSIFLLWVALSLTLVIFVANVLLSRPLLESLMFSLAIAIGMTPQLLPAVVSTGLSLGSRRLAAKSVLVKRLISIEDLGDIDLLVTDKTGTLTRGDIAFDKAHPVGGADVTLLGLLATEVDYSLAERGGQGLSAIDSALWTAAGDVVHKTRIFRAVNVLPFDSARRRTTVLVSDGRGRELVITKGSPEDVLRLCHDHAQAQKLATNLLSQGLRVIAVASRAARARDHARIQETNFRIAGFLAFTDPLKSDVADSLRELAALGIDVRIATGDSAIVARKVCADVGLKVDGILTGDEVDRLSAVALAERVETTTVFARVSPEQKARIVSAFRRDGRAVGFLGDGVNDALALHDADVGLSVDTGSDVAKDAADVILLNKDLGVLAKGVAEGRRIFANTMKYVLMGTSGDFGNMFSAALGSIVLNFLPMLPGQVLLNDMLYDSSQMAIPGDRVDPEQVRRPSHWNIAHIRRFMLIFGPASSLFDFVTFGLMLRVFHASLPEFRAGWFVESLATEVLIVLVIRTRRRPFWRSRPSWSLLTFVGVVVAIGIVMPYLPFSGQLGFAPLPAPFFIALVLMVALYLVLTEWLKGIFYRHLPSPRLLKHRGRAHRVHRRARRFSTRTVVRARPR